MSYPHNENERTRKFQFGKIAYWPTSRKSNLVEVDICLKKQDNGEYEFTAMGSIWNCRHTDHISGGQNLDTIRKYVNDPIFVEIYEIWKNFHLNGLNSGTKRQKDALEKETERRNALHRKNGEKEEKPLTYAERYEDACKYLKSIGLYIDKLDDDEVLNYETKDVRADHYPYGRGWITYVLTESVVKRIKSLLDNGEIYRESEA